MKVRLDLFCRRKAIKIFRLTRTRLVVSYIITKVFTKYIRYVYQNIELKFQ